MTNSEVIVHLDVDDDPTCPTEWGGWNLHSFSRRHNSFTEPSSLGLGEGRAADGTPEVLDPELAEKLKDGRAFWASYYEHGDCVWALLDQQPQCQFDSAGLVIWEGTEEPPLCDERSKSAAGFLADYTKWCNGQVYGYTIETPDREAGCWGFYDIDQMFQEISEVADGRPVTFKGDAAELAIHHWPPKDPK